LAEVFCTRCGHRNAPDANFCSSCGASLAAARDDRTLSFQPNEMPEVAEPTAAVPTTEVSTGFVVVRSTQSERGEWYTLKGAVTRAGRHPDSDIFLDDITVSRRHAEIVPTPNGYEVQDVGSLNGTYLNHTRIDRAPLRDGDELQIGKFKLVFRAGAPSR
jgi:hypothetical protein